MADQIVRRVVVPAAPLLVGRDRELSRLRVDLGAALAGQGALVLLSGEAGIGKTALAEALCREAAAAGALVLVGRCYDLAETPPYGPWIEAFARVPRGDDLPAPPDLAEGQDAVNQAALFAQVRGYLAALVARHPVVLLLDDLHWADQASLDLLRVVGRGLSELPVFLLATHRADEVTSRHPLYQLLPLLLREARATPLALVPLVADDMRALVATRYWLAAADTERLVGYLHANAQGNPFYVRELLRSLEDDQIIRQGTASWLVGDLSQVQFPGLLRQIIGARVARLGEESLRLLALAAVIGHEVPLDLWAAVAGVTRDVLLALIERAVEARVLVDVGVATRVAFAHALVREALYDGISAMQRRSIHRRVAEDLLTIPQPDPDAVADHLRRAGDPLAVTWLIHASDRAQRAHAWDIAVQRLAVALSLVAAGGDGAQERGWLLVRLGYVQRHTDPVRAIATLDEAEQAAVATHDAVLALGARFRRGFLQCLLGRMRQGLAELTASIEALSKLSAADQARLRMLDTDDTTFDEVGLQSILVGWLAIVGPYDEALALSERLATSLPIDPTARAAGVFRDAGIHRALGGIYAALGQPEAAGRAFARSHAAWSACNDHFNAAMTAMHELSWVALSYLADQLPERRRLADLATEEFAKATGLPAERNHFSRVAHLSLLAVGGRWDEVESLTAVVRSVGPRLLLQAAATLGAVARARGQAEVARGLVSECLPLGVATQPGDTSFLEALAIQRLAIALALDAGDVATARAWLETHDRWLIWSGTVLGRADGEFGWACYYRATNDRTAARVHANRALVYANRPRQPFILLAANRLLGELAIMTGHHSDAAEQLSAALALADACAAPYERALCLLALAELYAAAGSQHDPSTPLAEARTLLADLGAAPALARADALAATLAASAPGLTHPDGLTAREVEVLRLYAADLSHREIAMRLSIAPRTVGTHVSNIYGKTGITSRLTAVSYIARHGLA